MKQKDEKTGIRKMKKMPVIRGNIGILYNRYTTYNIATVCNAHSEAIDYMASVISDLEDRIKKLEEG